MYSSTNANPPNDLLISASLKKKMSKQKVQNEKEPGSIRSTRLEKGEKTKLHFSLSKHVIMMLYMNKRQLVVEHKHKHKHKHKVHSVHFFPKLPIQVVHKHKHKLASLKC